MLKKVFCVAAMVLLVMAGNVSAVEVSVTGTYVVDGDYYNSGDVDYGLYSHELDLGLTFKTDEKTFLKSSFGIVDRTWGDDPATIYTSDITVDTVWLTHTFECGTMFEAGLMDGGVWGTMLGDAADGYLRLRVTKDFSFGTVAAYVQKNNEIGGTNTAVEDAEKDDADSYSVAAIFKAGSVSIMPMIDYSDDSSAVIDQGSDGTQTLLANLSIAGDMKTYGFEAEINYFDVSTDVVGGSDFSNINAYANVWMQMNALKAGVALAYGTEDDGNFVDFGADFSIMELMDNDDGYFAGLGAMSLVKIYGEYAVNDKLTLGAAAAYGNLEEDAWGTSDTGITEINLTGSYKITDALSYSVALAYGDADFQEDSVFYVGNEIEFSF